VTASDTETSRNDVRVNRGVCVVVPAADAVVAGWRAEHDWVAAAGLPAHVTVRSPIPGVTALDTDALVEIARAFLPLPVTLARLEDRQGALVVVAEPDDELRTLTAAFDDVLPGLPPHRGGRADVAYHVTAVRTADPSARGAAAAELAPHLPLEAQATALWLFEWEERDLRVVWRSPPTSLH
jgi:hypothetical protein